MLIIAHRGNLEFGFENSWTAFTQAVAHQCDRIELDVQFSQDHKPFVIHDEDLSRLTDSQQYLSQLSAAEVEKIHLKNGENIPRLEEVLSYFSPKISLNIELKSQKTEDALIVGNVIQEAKNAYPIIVSSFHLPPLLVFKQDFSNILRAVLWGSDTLHAPTFPYLGAHLFMEEVKTQIIHPQAQWVTEHFMDRAKYHNWLVFPWISINDERQDPEKIWLQLYQAGIHGLCTNFPNRFKKWISTQTQKEA